MSQKITLSEFKSFIQKRVTELLNEHKHFSGWDGIPIDMDTRDFAVIATMDEPDDEIRAEAKYAFEDGQIDEVDYSRIIWYLENIKPFVGPKKFPVHMNEEEIETKENIGQQIYDEVEMMMRPTDNSLTSSEINDLANMYGIDFETVLQIMQNYLNDRNKLIQDELKESVEYALKELEDEGNTSPNFNELVEKLNNTVHFTYSHSPQDIRAEFDKQTKDPNQLSLFEDFRKLVRKTLMEYSYETNINNPEQEEEEEAEREYRRMMIDKNKDRKRDKSVSNNDRIVDFQKEDFDNDHGINSADGHCMEHPKVCMSKPETIIDPKREI